jgi:hypothetical protein
MGNLKLKIHRSGRKKAIYENALSGKHLIEYYLD